MKRLCTLLFAPLLSLSLTLPATAITVPKADTAKKKLPAESESAATAKGRLVDINTATEDELRALPGVGDAYARRIISGRPYANKDQLVARKVMPPNIYEMIKDRVVAKQGMK